MALQAQCKGVAEEGSGSISVMKIISYVAIKTGRRGVGESFRAVWMANRTLVQNQPKMFYSILQVRNILACYVCGKL